MSKRCPTCGSDDPKVSQPWKRYNMELAGGVSFTPCPDPFHTQPIPPLIVGRSYDCKRCSRTHPPGPCENFAGNPAWKPRTTQPTPPASEDMAKGYRDLASDAAYQAECNEWMNAPMGTPPASEKCPLEDTDFDFNAHRESGCGPCDPCRHDTTPPASEETCSPSPSTPTRSTSASSPEASSSQSSSSCSNADTPPASDVEAARRHQFAVDYLRSVCCRDDCEANNNGIAERELNYLLATIADLQARRQAAEKERGWLAQQLHLKAIQSGYAYDTNRCYTAEEWLRRAAMAVKLETKEKP